MNHSRDPCPWVALFDDGALCQLALGVISYRPEAAGYVMLGNLKLATRKGQLQERFGMASRASGDPTLLPHQQLDPNGNSLYDEQRLHAIVALKTRALLL
jgi:hypothetical protein